MDFFSCKLMLKHQTNHLLMKILTDLVARILFALPLLVFSSFHFMNAEMMSSMAPFGGVILVYITGVALLAASVSIIIKKKAALATLLLGVFFILTATLVHLPGGEESMPNLLKDVALAGAALFMSGVFKKEEDAAATAE